MFACAEITASRILTVGHARFANGLINAARKESMRKHGSRTLEDMLFRKQQAVFWAWLVGIWVIVLGGVVLWTVL
jgi:hypothetical protein